MDRADFEAGIELLRQRGYADFPDLCAWCHPPFPKDGYGCDLHFLVWPFAITYEKIYEWKLRVEAEMEAAT